MIQRYSLVVIGSVCAGQETQMLTVEQQRMAEIAKDIELAKVDQVQKWASALAMEGNTFAARRTIAESARDAHSGWPQYDGHWETPEWQLVRVEMDVRTKGGLCFKQGDFAIARPTTIQDLRALDVYSLREALDVLLPEAAVHQVTFPQACGSR